MPAWLLPKKKYQPWPQHLMVANVLETAAAGRQDGFQQCNSRQMRMSINMTRPACQHPVPTLLMSRALTSMLYAGARVWINTFGLANTVW